MYLFKFWIFVVIISSDSLQIVSSFPEAIRREIVATKMLLV